MGYYDGVKLLSLKDINGQQPEIYICTSNRSAGKTTYFSRYLVNRYLKYGEKFAILYRFKYELANVAEKFFKDIQGLFFQEHTMEEKVQGRGLYTDLILDGECCGYALTLNSADQLKKYSHYFSDVKRILFDEFQSETDNYCPNEFVKFQSIHTSIARGQGEQYRYVPVFMVSNPVSIINPYYTQFKISSRLNENVKFLKGDGWVLEQGFNASASEAQKQSAFNRACGENKYSSYATEGVYLNDNKSFIEKMSGRNQYIMTLKYMDRNYGIFLYTDKGIAYCTDRFDPTYPIRVAVTTDDHEINYIMLKSNDIFLQRLKFYFRVGAFRFKNLMCKEALISAISY